MVLSKRERYIAIGTAAAVSLLVLDRFVLSPVRGTAGRDHGDRDDGGRQLADAEPLFQRQRHLRTIWAEIQKGGLKIDASQAESQALNAVLDWTKWSQANLMSLKPERTSQEGSFEVIRFDVTGDGPMGRSRGCCGAGDGDDPRARQRGAGHAPRKGRTTCRSG